MPRFALQEQVIYKYSRQPVWVVTRRPSSRYEKGAFYELSRKPGSSRIDFFNVPEKDLEPVPTVAHYRESITYYSGDGWVGVARHPDRLELVKS